MKYRADGDLFGLIALLLSAWEVNFQFYQIWRHRRICPPRSALAHRAMKFLDRLTGTKPAPPAGQPHAPLSMDDRGLAADRLVSFVVAGAQKGGTSALDAYLRQHPAICMARVKEVHFFDDDSNFIPGRLPDYSTYAANFAPAALPAPILGETTPSYMYWDTAPARLWQYNPDLKLIVILRSPIERAYSHWNMQRERQVDPLPFWVALQAEPERLRSALPLQHKIFSYIDRGFYTAQLRRLYAFFTPAQVLVLKNEDLRRDPHIVLEAIRQFLNLTPFPDLPAQEVHARPYISPLSAREKDYLSSIFEFEIKALERLLGWDCRSWLGDTSDED